MAEVELCHVAELLQRQWNIPREEVFIQQQLSKSADRRVDCRNGTRQEVVGCRYSGSRDHVDNEVGQASC